MKILVSSDTSTLAMLQLPPPFPPRGRGFSTKEDQLFTDKLTFYFNNCPEVHASALSCVISIFEEPEKFVDDVRSISMETLQDVSIGAHRYDPDFPTRKHNCAMKF